MRKKQKYIDQIFKFFSSCDMKSIISVIMIYENRFIPQLEK